MDRGLIMVMTIQKKDKNKTVKWIEREGFDDWVAMIPSGLDSAISESYGEHAVVYDVEQPKKVVDFCGTNIQNGCAVGRIACNLFIRNQDVFDYGLVLDDDYGAVASSFTTSPRLTKRTLWPLVESIRALGETCEMELGGYSAGAYPKTNRNIMNVFIIDKDTKDRGLNMILNEDVAHSILNWHRGIPTFGLGTVIRSDSQTAEMDKVDGNTKMIYATDRSYRKSFGSVLADPHNAKLVRNTGNTKRGALWHHEVAWAKIAPKIILED